MNTHTRTVWFKRSFTRMGKWFFVWDLSVTAECVPLFHWGRKIDGENKGGCRNKRAERVRGDRKAERQWDRQFAILPLLSLQARLRVWANQTVSQTAGLPPPCWDPSITCNTHTHTRAGGEHKYSVISHGNDACYLMAWCLGVIWIAILFDFTVFWWNCWTHLDA